MPKLNWSEDKKDKDGLVKFTDPKTGHSIWTFPTAVVYFPSGSRVVGAETTKEFRRI